MTIDLERPVTSARSYGLCGFEIDVRTTNSLVAKLVDSRFSCHPAPSDPLDRIVFDIHDGGGDAHAASPHGSGRPVYDAPAGQILYFDDSDQLFIDYCGAVRILCDASAGVVQSAICSPELGAVLAAHPFFTIPLLEIMKRKARFAVHAACVSVGHRGLLIAGGSGSGKSTLSLALLRKGCDFLSDDTVFLDRSADGIRASGFCDEIDVTDHTASMFPELTYLLGRQLLRGREKHSLDLQQIFGVTPASTCAPTAIVFPNVSHRRDSRLETISGSAALRALAPNVLLTEESASQAHFDILAELIRDVPCFSLDTGSELSAAAACLKEIIR